MSSQYLITLPNKSDDEVFYDAISTDNNSEGNHPLTQTYNGNQPENNKTAHLKETLVSQCDEREKPAETMICHTKILARYTESMGEEDGIDEQIDNSNCRGEMCLRRRNSDSAGRD